jgi:hypothetical protein
MKLSASVSASVKRGMESVHPSKLLNLLAPQVRFELTTLRLTAECSAIELLRSKTLKGERENTKCDELCQPLFVIFTNLMNANGLSR